MNNQEKGHAAPDIVTNKIENVTPSIAHKDNTLSEGTKNAFLHNIQELVSQNGERTTEVIFDNLVLAEFFQEYHSNPDTNRNIPHFTDEILKQNSKISHIYTGGKHYLVSDTDVEIYYPTYYGFDVDYTGIKNYHPAEKNTMMVEEHWYSLREPRTGYYVDSDSFPEKAMKILYQDGITRQSSPDEEKKWLEINIAGKTFSAEPIEEITEDALKKMAREYVTSNNLSFNSKRGSLIHEIRYVLDNGYISELHTFSIYNNGKEESKTFERAKYKVLASRDADIAKPRKKRRPSK